MVQHKEDLTYNMMRIEQAGSFSQDRCVYDTNGDGDCHHCVRRGGCENMGGPFVVKSKYPPGTPDSAVRGFEPK